MKKTKNTLARIVATAAGASALLIAGAAQAALQDRDLDGDNVVDAFYDTELDITWLRNANVNGTMNWDTAVAWADSFSFGGYDDWRAERRPRCGSAYNCTGSEMGHLWYVDRQPGWCPTPAASRTCSTPTGPVRYTPFSSRVVFPPPGAQYARKERPFTPWLFELAMYPLLPEPTR
jgi:hypothetical protein